MIALALTDEDIASIAAELIGATYGAPASFKLPNGHALRLTVHVDEDSTITDDEWAGTFSVGYDYGRESGRNRPNDMDGNAEKLQYDRGSFVWWQPAPDVPKRGSEEFAKMRAIILEILENGYIGLVVDLFETVQDSRGQSHSVEIASVSLWGIDNTYETTKSGGHAEEIVRDLISEVLSQ